MRWKAAGSAAFCLISMHTWRRNNSGRSDPWCLDRRLWERGSQGDGNTSQKPNYYKP